MSHVDSGLQIGTGTPKNFTGTVPFNEYSVHNTLISSVQLKYMRDTILKPDKIKYNKIQVV